VKASVGALPNDDLALLVTFRGDTPFIHSTAPNLLKDGALSNTYSEYAKVVTYLPTDQVISVGKFSVAVVQASKLQA